MLRQALWIGAVDDEELGLVQSWIRPTLDRWRSPLRTYASPRQATTAADLPTPTLAMLATDRAARWTIDDAVTLSRTWPLMPIVSVASSLVDGRRRSGPHLPGIDEVPWHELPGRLENWLHVWDTQRPGTLTNPSTIRRDERLLGIATTAGHRPVTVSVVAPTSLDADGLAALVPLAGGHVVSTACGRPALDDAAGMLLWDVGRISATSVGWLGILSANRPRLRVVVLDSFPRGDTARAALDAGAAAVLGKPLSIEALMGTIRRVKPGTDGLGAVRPESLASR